VLVEQNFRFASKLADKNYVIEHGQVVKVVEKNQLEASQEELKKLLGV
jgi:branched-chain amino acid transport system ATP-binding protein